MAFGGSFGSFTTSCLDDIPFKIGPKFKPPTKVLLPPRLGLSTPSSSRALTSEYSFEVELAVLKWSEERERQQEEQRLVLEQLEREQQETLALQQQQEEVSQQQQTNNTDVQSDATLESAVTNTEPLYDNLQPYDNSTPLYENTSSVSYPKPTPRTSKLKPNVPARPVYANIALPNPLLANISNSILTPTPISQSDTNIPVKTSPENQASSFDVTLFENEDDPFENMELQTINDLEELKTVLEETNKLSPSPQLPSGNEASEKEIDLHLVNTKEEGLVSDVCNGNSVEIDGHSSDLIYENVDELSSCKGQTAVEQTCVSSSIDLSNLPPVPPRRDLVGKSMPLPPIGALSGDLEFKQDSPTCVNQSKNCDNSQTSVPATNNVVNNIFRDCNNMPFPVYSAPVKTAAVEVKPPRNFKYTRHNVDDMEDGDCNDTSDSVSIHKATDQKSGINFSVGFHNARSAPELHVRRDAVRKAPPVPIPRRVPSPPSRPSSNQIPQIVPHSNSAESLPLWNRYDPLPPTPSLPDDVTQGINSTSSAISPVATANNTTTADRGSPDPYGSLSGEARKSVDNLVSMGFSRPRVSRAVERLGKDEKEVVEYLFLVDQLIEKGYNVESAEMALLMFHNSPIKATRYLDLFTQFQELGFSGDKIKEVLVDTNNDREKALDILTAT